MAASSGVVLANLAYLMGAVVLAFLGGMLVWWRHRKPKSVDANMASFNRGLRALAPEGGGRPSRREMNNVRGTRVEPIAGVRIEARPGVRLEPRDIFQMDGQTEYAQDLGTTGAEEASGQRAGAESG